MGYISKENITNFIQLQLQITFHFVIFNNYKLPNDQIMSFKIIFRDVDESFALISFIEQ